MKFLAIVFLAISTVFIFFAYNNFSGTKAFLSKATQTKGSVIDFVVTESYDSEEEEYYNSYYPVIEFNVKEEDHLFQFESSNGKSRRPGYSIGQKIDIYYLKSDNSFHAEIDSFFNLWGVSVILSIFGFITGIFSLIFFKVEKNKSKSRKIYN